MRISLLISFFFIQNLYAFTLTVNPAETPRFTGEEIAIDVSSDGCAGTLALSASTLLDDVVEAVESYWNKVPTTSIRFIRGNILGTASAGLDLNAWFTAAGIANRIIVGCSNSATHFSGSTLAVASIGTVSGNAAGVVLLGDTARVASLSRDERVAVLAHEIGHSFGLGHSLDEVALMFFAVSSSKVQMELTRDDHDGITWLYPQDKELEGCLGSLGTIALIDDDNDGGGKPPWNFLICLTLGFLLSLLKPKKIKGIRPLLS